MLLYSDFEVSMYGTVMNTPEVPDWRVETPGTQRNG